MGRYCKGLVPFVNGDAHYLPFRNRSIGHVVIRSMLHYVESRGVLLEVERILMRRGHLVVAQKVRTPFEQSSAWYNELLAARGTHAQTLWTTDNLEELLRTCGFKIISSKNFLERRKANLEQWISRDGTIDSNRQQRILDLINNAPADVREELDLELAGSEIKYNRTWSVITARIRRKSETLAPAVFSMIVERDRDGEKEILLQKRKKEPAYYDFWEFPQGKLEVGETALNAIKRELFEETGLELSSQTSVVDYPNKVKSINTETIQPLACVRTLEPTDFLALAVIVHVQGEPVSTDILREHTWILKRDLPSLISDDRIFPLNKPMLEAYFNR